jgi:tetratricopeptide (TPR) repeat protein
MIKQDQRSLRYQVDLGYVYGRQGETGKATRQYEDILKDMPPERNQVIEVANAFLSRRENEYAIKAYEKGNQMLKGTYPFHLEMAMMYQTMGNIPLMVEEYLNYVDYDITKIITVQDRLQDAMSNDPDGSRGDILRKALLRRSQKYPERTYYSELLLWYSIQEKDFELALNQAKSIDRRQQEDGRRLFDLGRICVTNNALDIAAQAYQYVIDKGKDGPLFFSSRIELLNVDFLRLNQNYYRTQKELSALDLNYQSALTDLGKNSATIPLIRNYAHLQTFYLGRPDKGIELLNEALEIPGASPQQVAECKLELGDILLFTGEVWDATLLYSQVDKAFKNDPLGFAAKFKNAKLSFYIGEFEWAKAQVDVMKASTSKLIANDAMDLSMLIGDNLGEDSTGSALRIFAQADLLEYQNKDDEALTKLDSVSLIPGGESLNDDVLYKQGIIQVKKGNYSQADSLFRKVTEYYPEDILADNALFALADLNEHKLNNKDRAMTLYQDLMTNYPGSLLVIEARRRYRSLRGDPVN